LALAAARALQYQPMFKTLLRYILGAVVAISVAAAILLINLIWFRPWNVNLFYEKVFAETVFREPELLSSLGFAEQLGITRHNGKLNDESPTHQRAIFERWKRDLEQLRQYPIDRQSASQRLSTRILDWWLADQVAAEKWQWHDYPVNQLFGVQNQFPSFMVNTHRLFSAQDCDYYVMRLHAVPAKFDQLLENLTVREDKRITPPRFVVEEVLVEMNGFVSKPVTENILATSFRSRAEKISKLNQADRDNYQRKVEAAVTDSVYPAYRKLIDYFNGLLPKTTTDDGVWKLPDGDGFYAHALRTNTTTILNPDEVHALGLKEVERLETEMRTLLEANGFGGQPIAAAMTKLAHDPRFLYSNDDSGRAQSLAEYKRLIDVATTRCRDLFVRAPKTQCEVRRVEQFKETTSSGAYYEGGALDGTRPGVFFANLRDMNEVPKWSMPTLAYHEGVPGHHWQLSIARELKGVPQFRKVLPFTAYMEGWALYCEWLAKQAGWYEGDPFGDLGRLQGEMFRAVRLVVDTGIHAKHWTREQAIVYMREKTGMGDKEITSEIERYIVAPGQACAYKIGMLKFQELRAKAQHDLGPKFDQREFHEAVLRDGALPLDILEEQVNQYIKSKKA
jgi:uncharacterized protein (DUF885 family)